MTQPFDILVAGELNPDLVLSDPNMTVEFGQHEALVESATLTVGSSAAIIACAAARLGLRICFIGVVGDDMFGQFILDRLVERKVDVANVIVNPDETTGLSVILSKGTDRAILTQLGAIDALRASDITDDLIQQASHLHIKSYFLQTNLQPDVTPLFARAV